MYELIQLSEHDYYMDSPTKVGIVVTEEGEACLIDSGSDKDAGKKVLRIVEENGWRLKAILNTHSHADHIGGNKIIQDRTGCMAYAKGLERGFTNYPEMETISLYGGMPFKEIQNKFLMAQKSTAEELTVDVLPKGMEMIDLPGHCFEMVGFKTADENVFLADCVSSAETLGKYGLVYLWDPVASLKTLEFIKTLEGKHFIPSHAPVVEDITELADLNIASIKKFIDVILCICKTPTIFEEILKQVFDTYDRPLNAQQYILVGSTLRSYISRLYMDGRLSVEYTDRRMLWQSV